jgi:hypothetical protein
MGVYLEYLLCSMTVLPALLLLKNNIKEAAQHIKTYAGD